MSARLDALKILRILRTSKPNKGKVSLYLNKDVYEQFQKACEKEGVAAGETMDELMNSFVQSLKASKGPK